MAKARDIPSIEQGLHEAFKILKDTGVEEAIKKYNIDGDKPMPTKI